MLSFVDFAGRIASMLAFSGVCFTVGSAFVLHRMLGGGKPAAACPPVTLLKPLYLDEPGLEENLRTFCTQDYPGAVQIVFGVQDPADPGAAVVRRLLREFPDLDAELVIADQLRGENRKISNLINMFSRARHDVLIVSDSDMRVPRTYLQAVVAALARPRAGIVTALYVGRPVMNNVWAKIAAMGISYQFLPNACLGYRAGLAKPCFGSTIALSRQTLLDIGGFNAFADVLADDYEMGRSVRKTSREVVILPIVLEHMCTEVTAIDVMQHELRWARTISAANRPGHIGSLLTHPVPLALIGAALQTNRLLANVVLLAALVARGLLKQRVDRVFKAASGPLWLLPMRDLISFFIFLASFFGSSVSWRGRTYRVSSSGRLSRYGGRE